MTEEEFKKLNDGNASSDNEQMHRQHSRDCIGAFFIGLIAYSVIYFIFLRIPPNTYMTTSIQDQHSAAVVFWMWLFWYPLTRLSTIFVVPVILCFLYPLYTIFMVAYHNH